MDALNTISSSAGSTSQASAEITLSTDNQTTASEQLAGSIMEVHHVAVQIEEGAKEIEQAISGLQEFAESLRTTVEGSGEEEAAI